MLDLTCHELHEKLIKREVSSREITEAYLTRIRNQDRTIRAFVTVAEDMAIELAEKADLALKTGEGVTPLTGIPIALKDNMCLKGLPTTCSSKILENFRPPYNAAVVERLLEAGVVVVGKTNLDEFAMGSSTENSAFGATRNPWDLERVPGGSSGGSAAAVVSRETVLALGSDTGGSIRQPAAFCGVTGLKPTYGRVSRYGLIAFASSLDQIGTITRDVHDTAILMNTIAGYDERDSTSVKIDTADYTDSLSRSVRGMKIGICEEFMGEGLDPEIRDAIDRAVSLFEKEGCRIVRLSIPSIKYSLAAYYIIAPAEASSNLARYDGTRYGYRSENARDIVDMFKRTRREGFGREVKRRIMIGTYALSAGYYDAYYLKAQKMRTLIRRDFEKAFSECDIMITPATPTPAFKIGEKTGDPLAMYLSDIYTVSVNLAGLPAMVIPCGFTGEGLPAGMQIIGKAFDEGNIIKAGSFFQERTDYHRKKPILNA